MGQTGKSPFDGYRRQKDYLVCIDSDGCAMDTMDIKHIKCFGPCMVEEWGLENRRKDVLEQWNRVNLYSMTRGINRFKALAIVLGWVGRTYGSVPGLEALLRWTGGADQLSEASLEQTVSSQAFPRGTDLTCLEKALCWSKNVNREISQLPKDGMLPFPGVKEGIALVHQYADIAIVSSANPDAVAQEWGRHGLIANVDIMLAQNAGSKASCIRNLLECGYSREHVMMVGDAPGDWQAAEDNGVWFYPILVSREYESWRDITKAVGRLMDGSFTPDYQKKLLDGFETNLQG